MSAALPSLELDCCPVECDEVVVQNIPGPAGDDGEPGAAGADGVSAVTTLGFAYTMPAELASADATLASTAGLVIGENVFVQGLGTLQVTAILSATQATLKNLEDAATSAYTDNAAPGTIAPTGSRVGMTGLQGQSGTLSGVAGSQIKGTYPSNVLLAIPNARGALAVGNGTDAVSLAAGVAGYLIVNDPVTFPVTGIGHKRVVPIGGDTNAVADRLVRLSASTGVPIPIEVSRSSLKDPGGLGVFVLDETNGNARGTDAVDLQVNRAAVSQVASGAQSLVGAGQNNTASAQRAVVVGGDTNLVSGSESFLGNGSLNTIEASQCAIVGGGSNQILGVGATQSVIAGGVSNTISTQWGAILGGASNVVSAVAGSILGGSGNQVSAFGASIAGGLQASADKYGQRTFSAGRFSAQADCQQSDLIWRITTTNATANVEAFLDGASLRATIPSGTGWAFDIIAIGRSSAGVTAAWSIKGAIQNNAGVTALVSAVTEALLGDGTGGTWGAVGNAPLCDADNGNDALRIRVTGAAATTIRWAIHARLMELGH